MLEHNDSILRTFAKMVITTMRLSLLSVLAVFLVISPSDALTLKSRADTSGCGIARNFAGQTHTGKIIQSSGGTRTYDVYLPPNYDEVCILKNYQNVDISPNTEFSLKNKQTPLIISYHGHGGNSGKQRALDHFDDTTWNYDHIVIWPNGVDVSIRSKIPYWLTNIHRDHGKAQITLPPAYPIKCLLQT